MAVPLHKAMDSFLVPSRVLELHNILVPGMNDEEVVEVEEDVKLECLSFGNVLSTHIAGPAQSLLGDGTAAAALEKSEDENKDGDEGNTSHDTDDDVDEDIIAEDKSGTSAKGMKDEMGRKSSQGNTNKKLNKKKDKTKYWGNVYIEFARPETATLAALQFSLRKYDERAVGVKFIPLSEYQVWPFLGV